jgi:hypothetical protein
VRTAICATTGDAPSAAERCPAVVPEWVLRRDLPSLRRIDRGPALSILSPHDGDIFVLNPAANAMQAREQQLALRAGGARRAVSWSVGGSRLSLDASGNAFWPLRLGTWRIEADDGRRRAEVTISVVVPPRSRAGFSYLRSARSP